MKTDQYRKLDEIGKGGNGIVWLVEDKTTGKQMAMKLILPDAMLDEDRKALFLRECRYACQLKHPNIVAHYTYDADGDIYLLMEYCSGGSVENLMSRHPAIFGGNADLIKDRVKMATHIILQVLDALEYAHQAPVTVQSADGSDKTVTGIVHRDIEPGNIFVMDTSVSPTVKVADFGLAKAFHTAGFSKYAYTYESAGKPRFIPRQQIANFRHVKPAVDVWAAAATYYYMLTKFYPKNIEYALDPFEAALEEDPVPILIRNPRLAEDFYKLAQVIDTALREVPEIGFQTAREFKEAINEVYVSE